MNKSEKNLVKAIEAGNYDEAMKAFEVFAELKSTSDEQSNDYFDKVEALNSDEEVVIEEEVIVEAYEAPIEAKEEPKELPVLPRLEKRGRKAKSKSRKDVEKAFDKALEAAIDYHAENKRGAEAKFARRLAKRLAIIKKQVFR